MQTFVIQIHRRVEPGEAAGLLEFVATGVRRPFVNRAELLALLEMDTAVPPSRSPDPLGPPDPTPLR